MEKKIEAKLLYRLEKKFSYERWRAGGGHLYIIIIIIFSHEDIETRERRKYS